MLRPKDFAGEPFVALGPTTPSRHRIDEIFARHGVARTVRVETPLSEIACALVASGLGLSICDPFTANEYSTRGVVSRPFEPALAFQIAALSPSHRALSPVAARIHRRIRGLHRVVRLVASTPATGRRRSRAGGSAYSSR